jgi:hypothetical protein
MMTANEKTANETTEMSEVVDVRELSLDELDATSGGWSVSFFGYKITGGDVADAAKWVWKHI